MVSNVEWSDWLVAHSLANQPPCHFAGQYRFWLHSIDIKVPIHRDK